MRPRRASIVRSTMGRKIHKAPSFLDRRSVRVHLDDAGRALVMRSLWLAMPRLGRRAPTDARRILLLRHDRIGDMLMSTGVIQWLASIPGARVDVAASAANAPVLEHDPAVGMTHVLGEGKGSIAAA